MLKKIALLVIQGQKENLKFSFVQIYANIETGCNSIP